MKVATDIYIEVFTNKWEKGERVSRRYRLWIYLQTARPRLDGMFNNLDEAPAGQTVWEVV